jgi:nudix-type nucleoside diphosphatase (YffH/AdpP family)
MHDRARRTGFEMPDHETKNRVRLRELTVLSDNHYVLRKARFDLQRRDGHWQEQMRESYDIGDGAAVLPVDAARGRVLLIRQFRWPAFEAGHRAPLIEAVAGKLDGDDPETCVVKEAMEEAGVRIAAPERVTQCFTSPGAVKERLSLFLAAYDSAAPRAEGGGLEAEGEDIEVLEMSLDAALALVAKGEIIDAKTILLLQAAKLRERQ